MATKAKNSSQVLPVYVIVGKDSYLVSNECDKIVASLLEEDEKAMGLFVADADKIEVAEVLDELRTLPFLAKRRVVVLKDAENFITASRSLLEKYFESPSPSGSLILTVGSWRSNTKLAKKIDKIGQCINVAEVKRWQLSKYAIDYAKTEYGKSLVKNAADLIVEYTGDDPGKVCGEVDKLALFAPESKTITAEHVAQLTGNNREYDAFGVIDSMTAGDMGSAVKRLRNMFAADKSAEYTIVGAFAFHFRRMFNAKVMQNKRVPVQQIANKLRIFGDKDGYFRQLSRWTLPEISSVMQALARIDYETKTGQAATPSAIEQLVIKAALKQSRR